MKVLLTGATGFVGRPLYGELMARGHRVVSVVRRSAGLTEEVVVPDIGDATDWRGPLSGCDAVVHLAARVHVMGDAKNIDAFARYRRTNTDATLNLARQAACAGVRRFVFVSSIKADRVDGVALPGESDASSAEEAYSASKWEAEQGLMEIAARTGMEVVIVRPPLVYGPGVKGNFAALVRWVRTGWPLPLGAVENRRSLLAVDNLVDFLALCADHARSLQAANQTFSLSDGEDVSTPELLMRVARAYRVSARLVPVPPAWLRFFGRMVGKQAAVERLLGSLTVDATPARVRLGWQPVVTMDEQLARMAMAEREPR